MTKMENKKILIITPFFAPETHAAVFRAHKLVKYLKREGWNPIVLTVDTNYNYNEDINLLEDLAGVEIHRTKYIEPSLRGLYMWLTGKDRTFKTLKKQGFFDEKVENNLINSEIKVSFKQKVYDYLLEHWLNSPDRFWTWEKSAVAKGIQLVKEHNIKYIYTSSLPFTTLKIGRKIKEKTGVKWVLDYRDPVMYAYKTHSSIKHIKRKQLKIENEAFETADKITMLGNAYTLIYHELYNGKYDRKMQFIPTGLDDDLIPDNKDNITRKEWVFVGEYLLEYENHFFKIFKDFLKSFPQFSDKLKIKIIGNININKPIVLPLIKSLGIENHVELIDHLSQKQLYQIISEAQAVILIPGYKLHWWNNFAKMVDYIALKKKIIAMIPNPSEARTEITKAGLGIFIEENDQNNSEKLRQVADNELKINVNEQYCKKYLASTQTKSFIEIFEKL